MPAVVRPVWQGGPDCRCWQVVREAAHPEWMPCGVRAGGSAPRVDAMWCEGGRQRIQIRPFELGLLLVESANGALTPSGMQNVALNSAAAAVAPHRVASSACSLTSRRCFRAAHPTTTSWCCASKNMFLRRRRTARLSRCSDDHRGHRRRAVHCNERSDSCGGRKRHAARCSDRSDSRGGHRRRAARCGKRCDSRGGHRRRAARCGKRCDSRGGGHWRRAARCSKRRSA
eukprot:203812-Chlamydomonas_euryale.AAC.9